jgi:hypothetical protein
MYSPTGTVGADMSLELLAILGVLLVYQLAPDGGGDSNVETECMVLYT